MIKIDKTGKRPIILVKQGEDKGKDRLLVETEKLKQAYLRDHIAYKTGKKIFNFKSSWYAHSDIKSALIKIQHGKCCFCESSIRHVSYGDVEHFRPKAAWTIKKKDKYTRPGYYWLAYDWDNLFFACQICNQSSNKGNLFPLVDESKRALDHTYNVDEEESLFIHPEKTDPEEHITFQEAFICPKKHSRKGEITIKELDLERNRLYENRKELHDKIKGLIDLYNIIPDQVPESEIPKAHVVDVLKNMIAPEHQYLNMIKANFGKDIQKIVNDLVYADDNLGSKKSNIQRLRFIFGLSVTYCKDIIVTICRNLSHLFMAIVKLFKK